MGVVVVTGCSICGKYNCIGQILEGSRGYPYKNIIFGDEMR